MDETVMVPLDLEETGTLCHLLMGDEGFRRWVMTEGREIPKADGAIVTSDVLLSIMRRRLTLYRKLAAANDKLMGKR